MLDYEPNKCDCRWDNGLAKHLKNHIGDFVGIYEKNGNVTFGILENVTNDTIKMSPHLPSGPLKFYNPGCPLMERADLYFILIGEIAEFAVNPKTPAPNEYCKMNDCDSSDSVRWIRKLPRRVNTTS